jgi:hypothetical protein
MKLTETKLKQMILLEMARIPPHIPTTDPEIERKVADLLTGDVGDINQASALLKPLDLTKGVKGGSYEKYHYDQTKRKITEYHFKVTQSFYDAIMYQLKIKGHQAPSNWANTIGEWYPNAPDKDVHLMIQKPYNLIGHAKYRGRILRSDEPYVEHLHITITEPVGQ